MLEMITKIRYIGLDVKYQLLWCEVIVVGVQYWQLLQFSVFNTYHLVPTIDETMC